MQSSPTATPDREARDEDARKIAACSQAFLARQGGRPRRLQHETILEICSDLVRAGVQPTVEAVRQVNGGIGSPNVIHPELKAYYRMKLSAPVADESETRAPDDPDLPELHSLWRELLRVADKRAHTRLAERETALDDRQAGLAAREDDLLERARVLEERGNEKEQLIAQLRADIEIANASARDARDASAERQRRVAQLEQELKAINTDFAQCRDQHQAEVRLLRDRLDTAEAAASTAREHLAVREGELATARTEAAAHTRRADEAKALANEARAEATAAAERANRLVLERAQLDLDLADVRTQLKHEATRADALATQHSAASDALEALRAEHATLQSMFDRRGTDIVQHQNALAQARASITVHERVQDELRSTREELHSVMRDRDQMLRNPPALLLRLETIESLLERLVQAQPQQQVPPTF